MRAFTHVPALRRCVRLRKVCSFSNYRPQRAALEGARRAPAGWCCSPSFASLVTVTFHCRFSHFTVTVGFPDPSIHHSLGILFVHHNTWNVCDSDS